MVDNATTRRNISMTNEEKKLYESFSKMSYEELFNNARVREDYSEELSELIC